MLNITLSFYFDAEPLIDTQCVWFVKPILHPYSSSIIKVMFCDPLYKALKRDFVKFFGRVKVITESKRYL